MVKMKKKMAVWAWQVWDYNYDKFKVSSVHLMRVKLSLIA